MRGINVNNDWKFTLEEEVAPHLPLTDDTSWKTVRLPHDWSMELPYDGERGYGCTGYLLGGMGWYRKHFTTTPQMQHKKVVFNFDGVYNRASFYCNGKFIKFHPYGYSPCLVDVTDYLNASGQDNVLAVRVDHTRYADSRWYTGSGIYRKVSMHLLPQIHIPVWGIYITTPVATAKKAVIKGQITVNNGSLSAQKISLKVALQSPEGQKTDMQQLDGKVCAGAESGIDFSFQIEDPILWEIHEGKQYRLSVVLHCNGEDIQEEVLNIGIRSFEFNTKNGFIFNGRKQLIKGVCLHHDGGAVGAAVPLDVWKRRLQKLKDCGCNAIRTAHNPVSEDFLDLCDKMGFLVQEEFYDEWDNPKDKRFNGTEQPDYVNYHTRGHAEFFREYAKSDLQNTMLRDRNHPCIIQWSIGNEIEWTYPKYNVATGYFGADASGNYFWTLPPYSVEKIRENMKLLPEDAHDVGKTAKMLSKWTREMDVTRPVVANCILPSASYESGYTDALDMVGYSYRRVVYDYGHKNYPDKPIMGTENVGQWHEWKAVLERDFIPGIFLWTGIDYIGESRKPYPQKGDFRALLNYAGHEMPSYYMFQSLWTDQPVIHLETQTLEKSLYVLNTEGKIEEKTTDGWKQRLWRWHDVNRHWNYEPGTEIVVEAYTNCAEAALFLNGKNMGTCKLADQPDHIMKWAFAYEEGTIEVFGKNQNEVCASDKLVTAGKPVTIKLWSDTQAVDLHEDSVAHVELQMLDAQGNPVMNQEEQVYFTVSECGRILGIDNGAEDNVADSQGNTVKTFRGKALLIVRGVKTGEISVQARTASFGSNCCKIEVNP